MFGHDCKEYFPNYPEKGDEFICICTAKWVCVRTFPWAKWDCLGREGYPRRDKNE
jgi:hypothetical protein